MYRIQVVMSTYNGELYIEEQINSIFNQKGCEIDLLIRDDGSTDNTINIIKRLSQKYKIKLLIGENLRPAKSFLTALKLSDKDRDYYAFSDQDDYWQDDKIISAIHLIEKENKNLSILYTGNLCAVDKNLNILNEKILSEDININYRSIIASSSQLFGCTMVFNKKLRDYVCRCEFNNPIMHDLWVGLLASLNGKIVYDPKPHILYRQHGNNQVGSQLTFKDKMKNRINFLKGHDRGNIARQAKDIYKIIENDNEISDDIKDYTKIVAFYNKSLKNKLYYLKKVDKTGFTIKRFLFHVILILGGNL